MSSFDAPLRSIAHELAFPGSPIAGALLGSSTYHWWRPALFSAVRTPAIPAMILGADLDRAGIDYLLRGLLPAGGDDNTFTPTKKAVEGSEMSRLPVRSI